MIAADPAGTLVTAIGGARAAVAVAARAAVDAAGEEGAAVLFEVGDRKARPATVVAAGAAKELEAILARSNQEVTVRTRGRLCFVSVPDTEEASETIRGLAADLPAEAPWVVCAPASQHRRLLETIPLGAVLLRADRSEDPGAQALLALVEAEARFVAGDVEVIEDAPGRLAARRWLAGSAGRVRVNEARTRPRLLQERGQATPLVLGAVFVLVLGTVALVAIAGAITGKARAQSVADLSAMSAARSMKRDLPRLLAPPTLPNGAPNPYHMPKVIYLARARFTAVKIAVGNGASPLRVSVRFPDSFSFAPVRARVSVRSKVESGGVAKWTSDWGEARVGAPVSMGAVPAMASGGGYSGPLAERQGHGMRPDVAAAFDTMVAAASAAGVVLTVNSAFRSDAEQAALFAAHPDPTWVARPGTSLHRCATEIDFGASDGYAWLAANAGRFGFVQRYSWEAWHFGFTAGPAPCSEAGNSVGAAGGRGDPQTLPDSLPSFVPKQFRAAILRSAMKWNVSAALLAAQLYAESGFDPNAGNGIAFGIAAFTPATAAEYGLKDPFNPDEAINAQGHLMSDLLKQFGSPALALAAYNAGPGAVAPCNCIPPYPETQAYVAKILGMLGGIGAIAPIPMEVELVR